MKRTLKASVINIVLPPPHGTDKYQQSWRKIFEEKKFFKIHGDTCGMIGSAYSDENHKHIIYGDLYRFTQIEVDGQWLDLDTGKAADAEIVDNEIQIPKRLHPNFQLFPYAFDTKTHRLYFVSKLNSKSVLSPLLVKRLIEASFHQNAIVSIFGKADITIEPTRETLDKILSLFKLKKLEITVTPPNSLGDIERDLFENLNELNATTYEATYSSEHPEGLKLSDNIKQIANIAQSNGVVKGQGKTSSGENMHLSTTDHPFEEKIDYDDKTSTQSLTLRSAITQIAKKILGHKKTNEQAKK